MTTMRDNGDATVAVQCTVPEYQRREWEQHADELDMSLSEFIRCMTQAGRNGFTDQPTASTPEQTTEQTIDSNGVLEFDLLAFIQEHGPTDWDDVLAALESDIEEALNSLQKDGPVVYNGRAGGYTVTDSP